MNSVTEIKLGDILDVPTASQKVEKKSGKRVGYNYIIIKSLKESQKNDVVKCLYIKSLTNFGFCVIKEGTHGDSKDRHGRDIKDRLLWQQELHQILQDKIRLPRYIGSFEENGNYYLVIEHIKGKSLHRACKEQKYQLRAHLLSGNKIGLKFMNSLIQLVILLDNLHKQNIVHRDVSSNNFMIMPNGKIAVIDMELSYSLNQNAPNPPFQLGTYGYMSPEQISMASPTVQQDIFSVGAIILEVWSGISPIKLTDAQPNELCSNVHFFIPDKALAEIVVKCLHPDPAERPTLMTVHRALIGYRDQFHKKKRAVIHKNTSPCREQLLDIIQKGIGTLSSPLLATADQGWFSEDKKAPSNENKTKIEKIWFTSFSNGAAGIIYFLSKSRQLGLDIDGTLPYLQKFLELTEGKYINRLENVSASLHAGSSGIAVSLASAMHSGLIPQAPIYIDWINKLLSRRNSEYGYIHGMSGQGIAHWLCYPFITKTDIQERLHDYVLALLSSQENDGCWLRSKSSQTKRATRGFAYGVSGIIYFLLEYGHRYNDNDALEGARHGLNWLVKKSYRVKGTIYWKSSLNRQIDPWWCEGAPGIALAFMKAYSIFMEPLYAAIANGALRNHPIETINTNLGQYSGLSGLGEIYLEAFRILKNSEWFDRASWIADVLLHTKKQHLEYGPYWLVEHEREPIADFMTGNSGVLHFLLRYCHPEKVGFPLLN